MNDHESGRDLTVAERNLVQWMLEHGNPEAGSFLTQLEHARATPWRCPCGCARIHFAVEGQAAPAGPLHILADFFFGPESCPVGIFVFEQNGILAGLDIYGFTDELPQNLPTTDMLRPYVATSLKERAARGSPEEFERLLALVPDVEPEERDRLSPQNASDGQPGSRVN